MKNILLAGILVLFTLISCEKLETINKNPNNVSETHPQLLLTGIEWNAFQVTGTGPLYASRMILQTDGENVNQYYKWDRGSFDDYDDLRNVTKMMEEAKRIENPEYEALAKFFRAYYFYNLSLSFGDIPYSDALKGESERVFTPSYDQQKDVFTGILNELKEADDLLVDQAASIEGDIIYNGDPYQWRKLINSFRLKVLLSLSKHESDAAMTIASKFAEIAGNKPLLESNTDNGQLVFIDQVGSRYTEYNNSGFGSGMYMDSTFIKRLQEREDPRLFIFCSQTRNAKESGLAINDFAAYEGGNPVAPYNDVNLKAIAGNTSKVNLRYTTDPVNEPAILMGYSELQLILAEARVRGWITTGDAATYYAKGVNASFAFYNQYAENYAQYVDEAAAGKYLSGDMVNFANTNSTEEQITLIIYQKYFGSFLQGGWTMYFDHLRTGYPAFASLPGETPPARWMYPNSEYQLNKQNVSDAIARQFGEGNDKIRQIPWWLK